MHFPLLSFTALCAISLYASAGYAQANIRNIKHNPIRRQVPQAPPGYIPIRLVELQELQIEYTAFHGWMTTHLSSAGSNSTQIAQLKQDVQAYDIWINAFFSRFLNSTGTASPSSSAAESGPLAASSTPSSSGAASGILAASSAPPSSGTASGATSGVLAANSAPSSSGAASGIPAAISSPSSSGAASGLQAATPLLSSSAAASGLPKASTVSAMPAPSVDVEDAPFPTTMTSTIANASPSAAPKADSECSNDSKDTDSPGI